MKILIVNDKGTTEFSDFDPEHLINQINELSHKIDVLNDKLNGLKGTIDYLQDVVVDNAAQIADLTDRVNACCPKK